MELSHIDENGKANMVDIAEKKRTLRTARAEGFVKMKPETQKIIRENAAKKGDVLSAASFAGIQGAKKTWELIPLCHNIPIDKVDIHFEFVAEDSLKIESFASCEYKTGIEMEALTAVSIAALCIYDMCKAIDRSIVIENIRLLEKTGGRSGEFKAL